MEVKEAFAKARKTRAQRHVEGIAHVLPPENQVSQRPLRMNSQQLRFIKEWAEGNSPSAAALRAGYSTPTTGWELARNPQVAAMYLEEKKKFEAAAQMKRETVMDMLKEAYDMAKLQAEPMTMVAAAREIGKMCGYYAPTVSKIKIEGNVHLDRMNRLSDAELLELVNENTAAQIDQIAHNNLSESEDQDDAASPLG